MKFFVALSANILITAIVVFLCYAAATTPTSTYLVAGLVCVFCLLVTYPAKFLQNHCGKRWASAFCPLLRLPFARCF